TFEANRQPTPSSDLYVVAVYALAGVVWLVLTVALWRWVPRAFRRRRESAIEDAVTRLEQRYPGWVTGLGGCDVLRSRQVVAELLRRLEGGSPRVPGRE